METGDRDRMCRVHRRGTRDEVEHTKLGLAVSLQRAAQLNALAQ